MADIDVNSSAVQAHVAILQGVIGRMAANSAAGKTWCVGLVSAIVVLLVNEGSLDYLWVALIPLALFATIPPMVATSELPPGEGGKKRP